MEFIFAKCTCRWWQNEGETRASSQAPRTAAWAPEPLLGTASFWQSSKKLDYLIFQLVTHQNQKETKSKGNQ